MKQQHRHLYFFGDSICYGQGVSIHRGWVPRMAAELYELGFSVANAAVNGDTTRLALERMPYEIQSHKPEALVVQFGMNDCNYWQTDEGLPRVSPRAFAANMEEIVNRGLAFGARCVFVHTNHPTTRLDDPMPGTGLTYQQSNEQYNQIIRETFADTDERIILTDIETAFKRRAPTREALAELLLPDALHLSEAGHDHYLKIVAPVIKANLARFFD